MKGYVVEFIVGVFVVVGIAAMSYLSIKLGDVDVFGREGYTVYAEFDSTSGLKEGAVVEIAGVEVGKVDRIGLKDYFSIVEMRINPGVRIPKDAIASIRTRGLIGEKFVKVNPGGSDEWIETGGKIIDTESSVDIEELIGKYIFSLDKK